MSKFKVGDRVILSSGGPIMTVEQVKEEENTVICTWFDKKEELKSQKFHEDLLEKYDEPFSSVGFLLG